MSVHIRHVAPDDIELMIALLDCFGEAFNDANTYSAYRSSADSLKRLLNGDSFIPLAALKAGEVVGGIAAFELKKFEQERSEIYIYDLGVRTGYRRQGVATAMIEELKMVAEARGAYMIFVQADTGMEDKDKAAIALYTRLGVCEEVLHFGIPIEVDNGVA